MKTAKILSIMIFLGILLICHNTAKAQVCPISVKAVPERTQEEKDYYRLFETPDNQLSISDQKLKYKIFYLVSKNYYVKDGEIKTLCKEEDFVKIGAKPYFYKFFIAQLEEMNTSLRESGIPKEKRQKSLENDFKAWKSVEKHALDKLEKLKKLKDTVK